MTELVTEEQWGFQNNEKTMEHPITGWHCILLKKYIYCHDKSRNEF